MPADSAWELSGATFAIVASKMSGRSAAISIEQLDEELSSPSGAAEKRYEGLALEARRLSVEFESTSISKSGA